MPESIYNQVGSDDMSVEADAISPDENINDDSGRTRRINPYKYQMLRSNAFLMALFITGAAVVYGLSIKKEPAKASAEQKLVEAQIDSAILRLSQQAVDSSTRPSAGRVTREILRSFQERILKSQIPLRNLAKNPFVFVPPVRMAPVVNNKNSDTGKAANSQSSQRKTQQDIIESLKKLHLQSVMIGKGGATAIISNNLLTVGQKIEGFTIESISPRMVVLSRQGKKYILEVE